MKNNKTSIAIVLFLMFAMTISLVAIPAVADEPGTMATYAYIGAMPNPVGVGQEVLLHFGISMELISVEMGWEDLTIRVEKPDGTTETLGPYRTDSTGGSGTIYVPTMVGTYYLQTHFPEQATTATNIAGSIFASVPIGTIMLSSSSEKLALIVQEEPLPDYPGHPLPAKYWTRPIDAQLREWHTIAGNWLERPLPGELFTPYNDDAPETAHILWTKTLAIGGLVGGEHGPHAYEDGDAYQGYFAGSVIVAGILIYNEAPNPLALTMARGTHSNTVIAIDLRTGEEVWSKVLGDNERVSFAQVMYWDSQNYHGVFPYVYTVVGSTWKAYNPLTGDWVFTMTNVPGGANYYGPKGEILRYQVNSAAGWMALWNSSNIPELYGANVHPSDPEYDGSLFYVGWGNWMPWGKTVNATGPVRESPLQPLGIAGYSWNITIPTGLPGSVLKVFPGDVIIGTDFDRITQQRESGVMWGISLESGNEGRLLFNRTWNFPPANRTLSFYVQAWDQENRVWTVYSKEERAYYGFSLDDGRLLWGPTESEHYLEQYKWARTDNVVANGKMYSAGYGGTVHCYDIKTGETLWTYDAYDPYNEILWGVNWPLSIQFFAGGKLYLSHTEHSPVDPKPRGSPFICLDGETGEEIWRINGAFRTTSWGGMSIIGDSIIVAIDTYDNRIYAIGKGPSATTVNIQNDVTTHGSKVLVTGRVTDVSPGTEDYALRARFPHGVPAVADQSMSDWMLHVYKQFARPAEVVGVEVVVSVLDPNNNCYEVGRTIASADGTFGLSFEPEVPGLYEVMATFAGSGAYYGSHSTTYVEVEEALVVAEPTPPPASAADVYLLPGIIGIIITIVVVGAVIVLMQRKK